MLSTNTDSVVPQADTPPDVPFLIEPVELPETLDRNLSLLNDLSDPATVKRIRSSCAEQSPVRFDTDGIRFVSDEGGSFLLHSRRDPEGEAERQVSAFVSANRSCTGFFVVLGFAGGWHIRSLIHRLNHGSCLFIADPSPAAMATAARHVRFHSLIRNGIRLRIVASDDVDFIADSFLEELSEHPCFNVEIFPHPGLKRVQGSRIGEIEGRLRREARRDFMNRSTVARFGHEWQRNALSNLPNLLGAPSVSALKGICSGLPAAVVAAGPSLDRSLSVLQEHADRMIVVSVAHAAKKLLKAGIVPDFIVAVDCAENTLPQFDGLDPANVRLITTDMIHPEIARRFAKRMFLFASPAISGFNRWISGIRPVPESLATGGTVAVTAIDAALYAGCEDIYVFGLDLSFPEDGTTHASNTDCGRFARVLDRVRIPGNYAELVMTTGQFAVYVDMVNAYLRRQHANRRFRICSVTDAGARIEMETVLPGEFVARFRPKPFDKSDFVAIFEKCVRSRTEIDCSRVVGLLDDTEAELRQFAELANRASRTCVSTENLGPEEADARDDVGLALATIKTLDRAKSLVSVAVEADLMEFNRRIAEPEIGHEDRNAVVFCAQLAAAASDAGKLLVRAKETLRKQP
jgi:hypothetical protein